MRTSGRALYVLCRKLSLIAVSFLLLISAPALSADPQAGRINTITPPAARPGERVTINGIGFGGPNVRITVGGTPAQVITGHGDIATFLVPQTVLGATTVTATNPGGHTGSIGFQVLLGLTVDTNATVQAAIGPNGGTLRAQSGGATYFLTIPAAALDVDTTITLAPVKSITNLPFSLGIVGAAQFEPSGLRLHRPATLTITLPAPIDPTGLLAFLTDDQGLNLEVFPVAVGPTTLTLPVNHFTLGGIGVATLADFQRQVLPLLNALPPALPPTQVVTLMGLLVGWIDRFGFDVCFQSNLCQRVFDIGVQSLLANQAQVCVQAEAFIQQGEPFLARDALASVIQMASLLQEVRLLATEAGVPGFDQPLDLSCTASTLRGIVDLAAAQSLANPRAGVLLLLEDVAGDAALLTLEDVEQYALSSLAQVIDTLVGQAEQSCLAAPDAGEFELDLILNNFSDNFLDGLKPGLADRVHEVRAGCRIHIAPALATITLGQSIGFTATTLGLSPPGVTWSVEGTSLGSSIDSTTGLFTAGQTNGSVVVKATSLADSGRFKKATVTIGDSCTTTSKASPATVKTYGRGKSAQTCGMGVTVSPLNTSLSPGASLRFNATVVGASDLTVKWSATGGTIDNTGLYTAGSTPGPFVVRATSVADPSAFAEASITISSGLITLITHSTFIGACASADIQVFTAGFVDPSVTFAVQGDARLRNQTLIGTTTFTTWAAAPSATGQIIVMAISVENPNITANATLRVDPIVAAYGNSSASAFVARGADANLPDDTYRFAVHVRGVDEIFSANLSGNVLSGANPSNGDSISVVIDATHMQGSLQAAGATIPINLTHNCSF